MCTSALIRGIFVTVYGIVEWAIKDEDAILKAKLMVNNGGGLQLLQPIVREYVWLFFHSANSDRII